MSWDTKAFFNSLTHWDLDGVKEFFVVRGGTGERYFEKFGIFAYKCVKTQDFKSGAYMERAREVKIKENNTSAPFTPLQGSTASGGTLNGFEKFFQHS